MTESDSDPRDDEGEVVFRIPEHVFEEVAREISDAVLRYDDDHYATGYVDGAMHVERNLRQHEDVHRDD